MWVRFPMYAQYFPFSSYTGQCCCNWLWCQYYDGGNANTAVWRMLRECGICLNWFLPSVPVLGDSEIRTSWVRSLVDSNQWFKDQCFSYTYWLGVWHYSDMATTSWFNVRIIWPSVMSCQVAGDRVSQWASTMKSPWVLQVGTVSIRP